MHTTMKVPTHQACSLIANLDAIRGETAALKAAGMLAISVDDLLDGGGTVYTWLADLDQSVASAAGTMTHLPTREPGMLQHIVYGLSSVLVWAHTLQVEGRMGVKLSGEGLALWARVESLAGLPGRTSGAIGIDWATPDLPITAMSDIDSLSVAEISLDDDHALVPAVAV